jgi:hypothetical protein
LRKARNVSHFHQRRKSISEKWLSACCGISLYGSAISGALGSGDLNQAGSLLLEAATIQWANNGASNGLFCRGWEDNL